MSQPQLILSTHALERMKLRKVSREDVERVLAHPDNTAPGKKTGTTAFFRVLSDRKIQVVASYLEKEKKWLIISVWVKGEQDPIPVIWQLISLPFTLSWWLVKKTWRLLFYKKHQRRR